MADGSIALTGGLVHTMVEGEEPMVASVVLRDGFVEDIIPRGGGSEHFPQLASLYDVSGMIVSPGFIDSHIHDEHVGGEPVIQHAMLRQGVTTGLSGNCGSGPLFADAAAMHPHPWVNLYYLVGNCVLRHAAGSLDRYSPSSPGQIAAMRGMLAESLEMGAMGVSLGLEYEPGASYEEIDALASVASEWDAFISTHIRYDDDRCVDAVREVISISRKWNVRVQVSHLGSMTFFHTAECADMIASAREEGARVTFDCYPYDAFCTNIGSAVFDDGFEDRWRGKGPEYLEAISGKFKGRRLDRATFAEMRRNEPDRLVVAYIMNEDEVEACIAHPDCVVASDTFYDGEGIHPRTSGTFPRALGMLRRRGYSWGDALRKVTAMPADALGLKSGRLLKGAAADIVVFDPENFRDMATYQNPFEPPTGVKLVFVGGKLTLENGEIKSGPHGAFRRSGLTAKSRPSC